VRLLLVDALLTFCLSTIKRKNFFCASSNFFLVRKCEKGKKMSCFFERAIVHLNTVTFFKLVVIHFIEDISVYLFFAQVIHKILFILQRFSSLSFIVYIKRIELQQCFCCVFLRSRCYVGQFFLRQFFWFSSTMQE
jgi:hypothetical protein